MKNGRVTPLQFETLDEFFVRAATAKPPEWLLEGLVPATGSVLLAGAPGSGKTWFCLALAKLATEKDRPCIVIEEESSTFGFSQRLRSMGFQKNANVFVLHRSGFRLDVINQVKQLVVKMIGLLSPVVVLDPLAQLWVGDENSTQDVSRLMSYLQALRHFEDALLLVPTHVGKAAANAVLRGEALKGVYAARGSTVLPGWFDAVLNIDEAKAEPGTIAMIVDPPKVRELDNATRQRIVIELGTGAITAKGVAVEKADKRQRILDELQETPLSRNALHKRIGGNRAYLLKLISELLSDSTLREDSNGLLEPEPVLVPGTPVPYKNRNRVPVPRGTLVPVPEPLSEHGDVEL